WALTDASGRVTDSYGYDEFGRLAQHQGSSTQPFAFAGQPRDAETGLSYLRARYYDPSIGRFVQRDPFAGRKSRPCTLNRYAYVCDNPINNTDPSGLDEFGFGYSGSIAAGEQFVSVSVLSSFATNGDINTQISLTRGETTAVVG